MAPTMRMLQESQPDFSTAYALAPNRSAQVTAKNNKKK
jgi:hypothetical protein